MNKDLRDQVLKLVLDLIDEWNKTGDDRCKVAADDIIRTWVRIFGTFNDPDPKVPKAGQPYKEKL